MTEHEWRVCDDPLRMFRFLVPCFHSSTWYGGTGPSHLKDRKLRLWVCAVARLLGRQEPGGARDKILRACEDIADGRPSYWGKGREGLIAARWSVTEEWYGDRGWMLCATCEFLGLGIENTLMKERGYQDSFHRQAEVAQLLREVVGYPPAPPKLPLDVKGKCPDCGGKGWRADTSGYGTGLAACTCTKGIKGVACSWLTPTVVSMARHAYDRRDFANLPILADALEEAGCVDDAMLTHLRGPDSHVRGCWAVDLLRGQD